MAKPKSVQPSKVPAVVDPDVEIPIETLVEYKQMGLSDADIGRLVGCSQQNVNKRLKACNLESLQHFKKNKAILLELKQRDIIGSLDKNKINAMSGLQAVTAYGILQDKQRVLDGLATDIVQRQEIDAEYIKMLKDMQDAGLLKDGVIDVTPEE